MTINRSNQARSSGSCTWLLWCLLLLGMLWGPPAATAWVDLGDQTGPGDVGGPDGIVVIDGSYVMNVGELHVNMTNWGLIGSQFSNVLPWSDSPSAQWPAGSGVEYLWAAGLWVGGIVLGEKLVSTGQYETEFRPLNELQDTIYEAIGGTISRPIGNDEAGGIREPEPDSNDDEDFDLNGNERIDEEILNGYDDDGDGRIDEDFAQVGNQMMVCTLYDNTRVAQERFPDHSPMNLRVIQQSYAWENDSVDDFVGMEFLITNIGVITIDNVYIGFFADCDIGQRGQGAVAEDDLAGSFHGLQRASDNSFVPISVGFMYDGAENGRVEGYIGILFLGHDVDPAGVSAPPTVAIRSFQLFSTQAAFDQGGDPTNDDERYQLLSIDQIDRDASPGKQNDYRFLISAGPFNELPPDETLQFQAGIVMGNGLNGLKRNAAEAALTWYGNMFDKDGDADTGVNGRESIICREDFDEDQWANFHPDYMDTTCVTPEFLFSTPLILEDDIFQINVDGETKNCTYVNLDNCFECTRQLGAICTSRNMLITQWNCSDPDISDEFKRGCTGVEGKEHRINWLVGLAPPPPGLRLWPTDNAVYVFWDDRSQYARDIRLGEIDFESYQIWRADNWDRPFGTSVDNGPSSNLWQMIGEYDIVNHFITSREDESGVTRLDTLPLGLNTDLTPIQYTPRVLDLTRNPRYEGLAEAMQEIVNMDPENKQRSRPAIFDSQAMVVPGMEPLLPWQGEPAALDTFWAVAYRAPDPDAVPPVREKRSIEYYEYVDRDIHNGFLYFYSVTATDHALVNISVEGQDSYWRIEGGGLAGDPGSSFSETVPGGNAQTAAERERFGANIYAYPNPATRDALAEFQQFNPNSDDPTGVRLCFANLPEARNTVSIFTLDGDLVAELDHDGTEGFGQVCWNLMSRNGQEIVSGIYLYSVESDDDRFDAFVDKFVVIR